jgi:transposase-like protein
VPGPTRRWKDVVADQPVNEMRVRVYEQLLEAEERIAHALYRRGVANEVVQEALDAIDERISEAERREDVYLSALKHYVEALGGHVEVRAVFGEDAIVVRREPAG